MELFLFSFILLFIAFAGIAIKIWVKKDGEFAGTCASQSPFLNKDNKPCGICGKMPMKKQNAKILFLLITNFNFKMESSHDMKLIKKQLIMTKMLTTPFLINTGIIFFHFCIKELIIKTWLKNLP